MKTPQETIVKVQECIDDSSEEVLPGERVRCRHCDMAGEMKPEETRKVAFLRVSHSTDCALINAVIELHRRRD